MELNEKLARHFLNIKKIHYEEWDETKSYPVYIPSGKPWRTHAIDAVPLPDFLNDFNACLKYIVPKLDSLIITYGDGIWFVSMFDKHGNRSTDNKDKSLPLAFCQAVGKLIKSQEEVE